MVGSRITDRVAAHYKRGRNVLEIIEWGENDEPLQVYSSPLTLAEKKKIQQWSEGDEFEGICRCIIMKAMDADGNPIFDKSDLQFLMRESDGSVLERIAMFISSGIDIMNPDSTNIGEAAKK